MDERRAKTLEALSTFIDAQKALLQRTQADLARLKHLREDIASTPAESCDILAVQNQLAGHRLSEHTQIATTISQELDWSVFASCDPTPFMTLAASTRLAHKQRNEPSRKQTSPLSSLQLLVKSARTSVIDPVIAGLPPLSSDEEEEPPDPVELRRIQERQKIRELKQRRIHGGSKFYGLSGLGLRKTDVDAVFVREDQEDESGVVDIGIVESQTRTQMNTPSSSREAKAEVDTPATSIPSPPPWPSKRLPSPLPEKKISRAKRPFQKAQASSSRKKVKVEPPSDDEDSRVDKRGRPRSETYKQAWSVSEQHLLERLLEEIPEGEKNRWAKISKAMDGRRTARQVASRVQKYFEKLKRFGVEVGDGN